MITGVTVRITSDDYRGYGSGLRFGLPVMITGIRVRITGDDYRGYGSDYR
jgi:hypothetical protein